MDHRHDGLGESTERKDYVSGYYGAAIPHVRLKRGEFKDDEYL